MKFLSIFCILFCAFASYGQPLSDEYFSSWSEILLNKKGKIAFYWYPSHPFIFLENNEIVGIEYEIASSFVDFLESEYKIELDVNWIKANNFNDVIHKITDYNGGVFGCSSISYTPERAKSVNFMPPYMPDISVIVSSANVPLAHTKKKYYQIFDTLSAIAIKNTTFDGLLKEMRDNHPIEYDISYINDKDDIIETLERTQNMFGYIDLPSFLIAMNKNTIVKRQFFYPVKLEGLSLVYPLNSDWERPIEKYFNSSSFITIQNKILSKYLGEDVNELMNTISTSLEIGPYEEIVILTKEKEFQYKELLHNTIKAQQSQKIRNFLIIGVIFVIFGAMFLYSRYYLKNRANKSLSNKQKQIEQKNLELKQLNEQKNSLINVLAHDLRTPIHQIQGMAQLFVSENNNMSKSQQDIIDHIINSSKRLDSLIGKILDVEAIETKQLNLKMEAINFHELIDGVVTNFDKLARAKNIELKKLYTRSIALANGDKIYLTQVIDNLLSNAIKFSEENKSVAIDIEESREHLTVIVTDQGPGFTPVDKQMLFKKFQQLSAKPTAGEQSTGLGLSIVKMYIDLMKASISCESKIGQGTTFQVTLSKIM